MVRFLVALGAAAVVVTVFFLLRPDSRAAEPRERAFGVSVGEGGMTPDRLRAVEGDRVTLRIRTDRSLELHVHGYDVGREVGPGKGGVVRFRADLTGRFGIEDHRSGREMGVLLVRPR